MYAQEQRKHILNIFSNIGIWLFEVLAFGFTWYHCYDSPYYHRGNFAVIGLYAVVIYFVTNSLNGYKFSYLRVTDLCISHIFANLCGAVTAYILICMVFYEYMNALPVLVMFSVQAVFSVIWVNLIHLIYIKRFPPRKIIIIYGEYPLEHFLEKLNAREDKYEICEILNYQKGLEKICSEVLDFEGVILYDLPSENRNEIIKYCYRHSIRTYVVPKITDIIMKGSDRLHLVDTPLLLSRNIGLNLDERFIKRTMDLVLSSVGIVFFSPLMLLIALVIKISDGGPILYKQTRLTRDKKEFTIYKFRSMKLGAEKDGVQLAKKNDSRITPVGKILRNLHLDELPQLFNVFAGDMAMVGPRPERPEIFEKYEDTIPEFDFRLKVKAGLTGYAQVYGKYNTSPIDKLKMDLTYIQEYSYILDLKILLLTFKIIFRKETSEGVDDKTGSDLSSGSNSDAIGGTK